MRSTIPALAASLTTAATAQFGGFDTGQNLPIGSAASSFVAIGDVDNDGDLDAVVSNSDGTRALLNDGAAGFTAGPIAAPNSGALGGALELGFLDGDAFLDAVWTRGGAIWTAFGDGAGGFVSPSSFVSPTGSPQNFELLVGEFNGDAFNDVVVIATTGGAYLLPGNGDGTFGAATQILGTSFLVGGSAADIDNDGDLDFAVVRGTAPENAPWVRVYANDGAGDFTLSQELQAAAFSRDVVFGDLNGDERPDLVSWRGQDDDQISVWLNDGSGALNGRTDYQLLGTTGNSAGSQNVAESVVLVNIDGDADQDIVAIGTDTSIEVLINDGTGAFAMGTSWPVGNAGELQAIRAGDLDGNGSSDVVLGSAISPAQGGTARFLINQTPTLPPSSVSLVSPPDDLGPVPLPEQLVWPGLPAPILDWTAAEGFGITYTVTIARDPALTDIAFQQSGIAGTQLAVPAGLQQGRNYYWSVTANNPIGDTVSTPIERRFFTRFGTDVDADGDVDFSDLNTLLTDFGDSTDE